MLRPVISYSRDVPVGVWFAPSNDGSVASNVVLGLKASMPSSLSVVVERLDRFPFWGSCSKLGCNKSDNVGAQQRVSGSVEGAL